jgi:uncharacterized membrane protein YpjA
VNIGKVKDEIRDFIYSSKVLWTAVLVNLAGTAFGFYYYMEQLAATRASLWIFVPDSPVATLAAAAAFYLYLRDRQSSLVETFAFFGNLKYGIWTVFVLIYMHQAFSQIHPIPLYAFLLASHALMVLQAHVILDFSEISWKSFLSVLGWFLVNDAVDYTLGTHSALPEAAGFSSPVAWVAVGTTLLAALMVYLKEIRSKEFMLSLT